MSCTKNLPSLSLDRFFSYGSTHSGSDLTQLCLLFKVTCHECDWFMHYSPYYCSSQRTGSRLNFIAINSVLILCIVISNRENLNV